MTLAELLARVWPTASAQDRKMMNHWAKLRDASSVLWSSSFTGSREDLKRIFDLLDADGSNSLSISELTRARILTKGEANKLLREWCKAFNDNSDSESENEKKESLNLSFNQFCLMTQKHLAAKYAHNEDKDAWQTHCRSAFNASKSKTRLKAVGMSVKVANAAFGHHRNLQDQSGIVMAH
jgi:Ca2+-binding EF-hand superfamily protein